MKIRIFAFAFVTLAPLALAAQTYKVKYEGGTLHDIKRGASLNIVITRGAIVKIGPVEVTSASFAFIGESQESGAALPSVPLYVCTSSSTRNWQR